MCLAIARCTSAPAEASTAQEYRLRLKVAGAHSHQTSGARLFKSSTRLVPRGSCPSRPSSAGRSACASLSARKICPAYFFDRNRTSKKLRQLPKPRLSAPGTVAISDEEVRRLAPSVFASQPIAGVSARYSFLPTSSILTGMRENGWVPVRALEQSIRTEARRGFQKHIVRFARSEHLQTWEKNQVRPEVVLVNSHDKSSAYQLHCGLFRLVCTNGLIVSLC